MSKIVLQVQRQSNGTYSVYHVDGWTVTAGLQPQNYDIVVSEMAAEFGGDWEELDPELYVGQAVVAADSDRTGVIVDIDREMMPRRPIRVRWDDDGDTDWVGREDLED